MGFSVARLGLVVIFLAIALQMSSRAGAEAMLSPEVEDFIENARRGDRLPVIVRLSDRVDLARHEAGERRGRRRRLVEELKGRAGRRHPRLRRAFAGSGLEHGRSLWAINGLSAEMGPRALRRLARHPGVERIDFDGVVELNLVVEPSAGGVGSGAPVEWNIGMVRADDLWSLGFEGDGAVVGIVDSGVDTNHPDLLASWRGGTGGWTDLVDGAPMPHDEGGGHGTQVAGLIVGGASAGTHVGVAPRAQWIAARAFDGSNRARFSALHEALQWMLDPDGDPATDDAPDVVNNSWGVPAAQGVCLTEFDADIEVLRAAGVAVVFAAGNTGPGTFSDVSPANGAGTLAVGAVDMSGNVPLFTARGPSSCSPGSVFPNLAAPGVSVYTTDWMALPPGYVTVSGTSFATPHVSAVLALLRGAFPEASVLELENVLEATAADVASPGPDNDTGHGLVDARAALGLLVESRGCPLWAGASDADADGLPDACDRCTLAADPMQRDTDGDGFGNLCDSDLNQDRITNFGDLAEFAIDFGTTAPDSDFNGNGTVDFGDFAIFVMSFGRPPGPSGLHF